jgi:hypothetical protein
LSTSSELFARASFLKLAGRLEPNTAAMIDPPKSCWLIWAPRAARFLKADLYIAVADGRKPMSKLLAETAESESERADSDSGSGFGRDVSLDFYV